jgi:RNA polymerase sigma factor (sigma-70 family)
MAVFPSTRWSVIEAARTGDATERSRALETLAAVYWKPVYTYLRTKWQRSPEDSADLTQTFFVELLERDLIGKFDEEKGRLRTYLRTCIDGFVSNDARAESRLKRGGGTRILRIEDEENREELERRILIGTATPEEVFEREWARSLFSVALERLQKSLRESRKETHLQLFERCDLGAGGGEAPSYADLAERFGIAKTDVTNWLAFARREFRRHVLDVLRELTGNEREFRQELRALTGKERE